MIVGSDNTLGPSFSIASIEAYLASRGALRRESVTPFQVALTQLKAAAVAAGDEGLAKRLWCLETVLRVQDLYSKAFNLLKNRHHFDGWCELEQVEIAINSLRPHFAADFARFGIDTIWRHVSNFQSLFPYKIFQSPEFVIHEKKCSICHKILTLRDRCEHRVGEIYRGEHCGRIISKCEFIGVSLVSDPVQKYSVVFLADPKTKATIDQYNYGAVDYVVTRLARPLDGWQPRWTKRRHPHARFRKVGRNDKCPCGSDKKYKKCCLLESGVLMPHLEVEFDVAPPPELQGIEYTY